MLGLSKSRTAIFGLGLTLVSIFLPFLKIPQEIAAFGVVVGVCFMIYAWGMPDTQLLYAPSKSATTTVTRLHRAQAELLYNKVCELIRKDRALASIVHDYDVKEYVEYYQGQLHFENIRKSTGDIEALQWELAMIDNPLFKKLKDSRELELREEITKLRVGDSKLDTMVGVLLELENQRNIYYATCGFWVRHAKELDATLRRELYMNNVETSITLQHQKLRNYINQLGE